MRQRASGRNSAPIIRDQPVVAKYEGRCKGCGHLILVGDILTKRHSTWVCRKCDVLEEDELTASMALVAADAAKPELVLSNSVKDRLREKMLRRLDAAGKRS